MQKLSTFLRTAGFSMIGVCIGFCIYDSWFNPAYQYGSAPLWVYLAARIVSCGGISALCFLAAGFLKRTAAKKAPPQSRE